MFNLIISIFGTTSLFFAWLMNVYISTTYVIAGCTHEFSLQAGSIVIREDVGVVNFALPTEILF